MRKKRATKPNGLGLVRWTINHAAKEFGADKKTISKKLATFGIPPGEDNCFSTYQIVSALNGDAEYKLERLLKIREERFRVQDENKANRLIYVEKREVYKFFDIFLTSFKSHVTSSQLDQDTKDEILKETVRIMDGSLDKYIRDARSRRALAPNPNPNTEEDSDRERESESLSEP